MKKKIITALLLVLAAALSIFIRLVPLKSYTSPPNVYKNLYLQTTHDAYYFMLSTKEIEKGPIIHKKPLKTGLGYLGFFLKKILAATPLDNIAFFSPVLLSSLTAIPLLIIGNILGGPIVGFSGAMITAFSMGWYYRTRIGYYDTDMLNLFFPLMAIAFLLLLFREKNGKKRLLWAVLCGLFSQLYYLWYASGIPINYAAFFMAFLYLVFFKKEDPKLHRDFLILYVLSSNNLNLLLKGDLVALPLILAELVLCQLYLKAVEKRPKESLWIFVGSFILLHIFEREFFVYKVALSKLGFYLEQPKEISVRGLTFPSVSRSISEVKGLTFPEFSSLILNSKPILLLLIASAVFMFLMERSLLPLLPMFILGLLSLRSNRLIIYAPPAMGLGFGYAIFKLRKYIKREPLHLALSLILITAVTYPTWKAIRSARFRPVLFSWHVKGLDRLGKMAKRSDIAWSWWDYGYITQYFSLVNTYGDGGDHDGNTIWPVAVTLTSRNQTLAANIMDLCASRYDQGRGEVAFKGYTNRTIYDYLRQLSKKRINFGRKRDVYLVLFDDIVRIFGWISYFGTWDFIRQTGTQLLYFVDRCRLVKNNVFLVGGKVVVDLNKGIFIVGTREGKLHRFLFAVKGRYVEKEFNGNAKACFIFLPHMGVGVLLDRSLYYSNYFRMMFTNDYKQNLFQLVYDDYPLMRIYRLR